MEMTSREIVKRCIEFRDPPRCGWHFAVEPLHGKVWPDTDFYGISPASDPRFEPPPGATEWVTEWGDTRSTLNTALGESIRFPLADGWHLLEQYRLPDLAAPERNAPAPDVSQISAASKSALRMTSTGASFPVQSERDFAP